MGGVTVEAIQDPDDERPNDERPDEEYLDAPDNVDYVEDEDDEDLAERQYPSLTEALKGNQPPENHALIRQVCGAVGATRFYERAGYVKAVRPDGRPALHIHFGWTNGFVSEEEVRSAVGELGSYWRSGRAKKKGLWGVTHPINNLRGKNNRKQAKPDYGVCPVHFLALPATKICGLCDG